jgi:murein DD-endopeptidase MepM/ murein hydrolase activator NlpD
MVGERMIRARLARVRAELRRLFPERHLYIRTGGRIHAMVLSTKVQAAAAGAAAGLLGWTGLTTLAMLINLAGMTLAASAPEPAAAASSRVQRAAVDPSLQLAADVERRHQALAMLISQLAPEAAASAPGSTDSAAAAERMARIREEQARLLSLTEASAKARAEKLKLAFRQTGLQPQRLTPRDRGQGGPFIAARDPQILAELLDVDVDFAARLQRASSSLEELTRLSLAAMQLPLAKPTNTDRSSGYGFRRDPFSGEAAFHSGIDFSGDRYDPVKATASGVVSFVGQRSGYGRVVEVDHGGGLKTRFAHLQKAAVRPGVTVQAGQQIGYMGSTGRSTGPHLHYEIWLNGRPQNPDRFLRAARHVQQAAG